MLTKDQIIASIRGQLVQANLDTVITNLGDASRQIQELTAKVKELEAEVATFKEPKEMD